MARLIVLRARKSMEAAEFEQAKAYFARNTKFDILVLPHGFDVMVEDAEPPVEAAEPSVDEPSQQDIETAREEVTSAYGRGKIVQYSPLADPLAGWIEIHRTLNPHKFEWDENYYRLLPAPRR